MKNIICIMFILLLSCNSKEKIEIVNITNPIILKDGEFYSKSYPQNGISIRGNKIAFFEKNLKKFFVPLSIFIAGLNKKNKSSSFFFSGSKKVKKKIRPAFFFTFFFRFFAVCRFFTLLFHTNFSRLTRKL